MPLALDPNQTFEFTLLADREKPSEKPTFLLRCLSCRQYRQAVTWHDQALDADLEKSDGLLDQVITLGLAGWKNMGREFSDEALAWMLGEVLSVDEKWELARAVCEEQRLREREKKASASRAPSGAAGSAGGAAANLTSATDAPAGPNR